MTPPDTLSLWAGGLVVVLVSAVLLRRLLGRLLRLSLRWLGGLAALAAFSQVGQYIGVTLGVNAANALVLGVLGAPGLGLLLMLQWALRFN